MKLTGKIEDPNSLALKIVSDTQQEYQNGMTPTLFKNTSRYQVDTETVQTSEDFDISVVIQILSSAIKAGEQTSPHPLQLSLQDETGHQLLHYAVILQQDHLVDLLLSQSPESIDVDLPGYPPFFTLNNISR